MINLKPPSGSLITLLAVAFVAFRYCIHETDQSLGDPARTSGWFLLGSFVLLCVYGVRKKLPFLPLGKTSTWLMLHLTTGVLGGYFFLEHTEFRFPTGIFDTLLWIGYFVILLSGFTGWVLLRTIPQPLRESIHLLPARIDQEIATLIKEADSLILELRKSSSHNEYELVYLSILRPFLFSKARSHSSGKKEKQYLPNAVVDSYSRHSNFSKLESNSVEDKIHQIVLRKSVLDRQLRLHSWMRGWLLIHLPFTGAMVIMILLHVILTHAFAAGTVQ